MKKINKRFALMAAALVFSAGVLSSCGGGKTDSRSSTGKQASMSETGSTKSSGSNMSSAAKTDEKATDINVIADKLLNEIKYKEELQEMNENMVSINYPGISEAQIKAKKIYIPSSAATAEEIACFEAVDEDAAKAVEEELKSRVEYQKQSFANYNPDEAKMLDNARIIKKGLCVFLTVSSDPDKAEKIIEEN